MINEERVKELFQVALYDNSADVMHDQVKSYFKSDYIGMQLIISFLVITVAFFVVIGVYLVFNFEEFMAGIYTMDLAAVGKKLAFAYIAVLMIYMAVTYIVYLIRYVKARKRLNRFLQYLNCLDGTEEEEDS